jgi:hypothetical protein
LKQTVYICFLYCCIACKSSLVSIEKPFDLSASPPAPNYSQLAHWAAHPLKKDMADSLPKGAKLSNNQENATADVFFVHPTIFTKKPSDQYQWNAALSDSALNKQVDASTILNQATVFNGSCKIYAPRYRQAHYFSFFTDSTNHAQQALDLAYTDIRAAFEYYLQHYNKGRPIVIASHSQGSYHSRRLLKEFFDGQALQKQLVVAYLAGYDVPNTMYQHIAASQTPSQIGSYACWNTYASGYKPPNYTKALIHSTCTNPITWSSANGATASYAQNAGALGRKFKIIPNASNAKTANGILWIDKLNITGGKLIRKKVWHIADINLFWMNIRQNVAERIETYNIVNKK